MTNSSSEPKDETPVGNGDEPTVQSSQKASSSSSIECTQEEASETGVVARCLKRRRSSDDDYPTNNNQNSSHQYYSSSSSHYSSSSNYYSSSNNNYSSTDDSSSNNYPPGFFTPEQEEALRKQREKIEQINSNIKKEDEKIERADACIQIFLKWPELIGQLGGLASTYGEQALQDLLKKIEEENLAVTDPLKKLYLLFTFFRNRRDMNIYIKNLIHQHVLILKNEMRSESGDSSEQNAICKYKY